METLPKYWKRLRNRSETAPKPIPLLARPIPLKCDFLITDTRLFLFECDFLMFRSAVL